MILKQLVERFDFDIISFIFKQYKKLEISLEQATVLMHLFNLLQSRKNNFNIKYFKRCFVFLFRTWTHFR